LLSPPYVLGTNIPGETFFIVAGIAHYVTGWLS
jgi:hypothetical protein